MAVLVTGSVLKGRKRFRRETAAGARPPGG